MKTTNSSTYSLPNCRGPFNGQMRPEWFWRKNSHTVSASSPQLSMVVDLWCYWTVFLAKALDNFGRIHGIMGSIMHQLLLNENLTAFVRKLNWAVTWSSNMIMFASHSTCWNQHKNCSASTELRHYHGHHSPLTKTQLKTCGMNWGGMSINKNLGIITSSGEIAHGWMVSDDLPHIPQTTS